MTKEQLEGSAARAADRGRDQLFGDNLSDNLLNSIGTVDEVVRSFATKLVDVRVRYNADKITDVQAQDEIAALAAEYAAIFMGQNKDYATTAWNSPDQLGKFLTEVMEAETTPDVAARDFLLWVASQLIAVTVEHESGVIDDEVAQFRVDALIEDTVFALLGISTIEQPEDEG